MILSFLFLHTQYAVDKLMDVIGLQKPMSIQQAPTAQRKHASHSSGARKDAWSGEVASAGGSSASSSGTSSRRYLSPEPENSNEVDVIFEEVCVYYIDYRYSKSS
jgi:hypothetical protein